MILTPFGIIELTTASVAILGALGVCLTRVIGQTEQSRCSKIDCLCIKCDRDVPPISSPIPEIEITEEETKT